MISKEVLDQIQELVKDQKISLFNFVLASYSIFLSKLCDQNDLIIDSPMSTRTTEDLSKVIGCLIGNLITRIKVDHDYSFTDMLISCKEMIIEALDHIYYQSFWTPSITEVVTHLNLINDISDAESKIAKFEPHHYSPGHVYFDFELTIVIVENGLIINCNYKTEFINPLKITEICKSFVNVVKMATKSPDVPIKQWKIIES